MDPDYFFETTKWLSPFIQLLIRYYRRTHVQSICPFPPLFLFEPMMNNRIDYFHLRCHFSRYFSQKHYRQQPSPCSSFSKEILSNLYQHWANANTTFFKSLIHFMQFYRRIFQLFKLIINFLIKDILFYSGKVSDLRKNLLNIQIVHYSMSICKWILNSRMDKDAIGLNVRLVLPLNGNCSIQPTPIYLYGNS